MIFMQFATIIFPTIIYISLILPTFLIINILSIVAICIFINVDTMDVYRISL